MELHELIIKAHAHSHAAELAAHAKSPGAAWYELARLRKLLNDQHYLQALEITDTPPPERSKT